MKEVLTAEEVRLVISLALGDDVEACDPSGARLGGKWISLTPLRAWCGYLRIKANVYCSTFTYDHETGPSVGPREVSKIAQSCLTTLRASVRSTMEL